MHPSTCSDKSSCHQSNQSHQVSLLGKGFFFWIYHFGLGFCPLDLVNILRLLVVLYSKLPRSFISWCTVNEDNLGQGLLIFCFYLWVIQIWPLHGSHVIFWVTWCTWEMLFVCGFSCIVSIMLPLGIMCDAGATLRVFLASVLCNAGDKASWSQYPWQVSSIAILN